MTATLAEPTLEIEIRSGTGYEVAEVNFPKRIVTVLAMPYERPTQIVGRGRVYTEVVSRTAFVGAEKRASQIRANRDHSWDKLVGKIVGLHPSRKEGLVAEVRMFKTDIGERTLVECDEGGLDASAGFLLLRQNGNTGPVYADAEVWEQNHTVRRLNRLRLDHLAFVPNPAYPDAAVLDVRSGDAAAQELPASAFASTPNRDSLTLAALQAEKAALDARWLNS
jgi:phage head maturation protease